jgi:hypothetical protein
MDISTGGAISVIAHGVAQRNQSEHSFEQICIQELSVFYGMAHASSSQRRDSLSGSGASLIVDTHFYEVLAHSGTDNLLAPVAVLFAANLLLLRHGASREALRGQLERSTMLLKLLKTGHGTVEALSFALLTVDGVGGGHVVESTENASRLARLLYALRSLPPDLQQFMVTALRLLLMDSADLAAEQWNPWTFARRLEVHLEQIAAL